MEAAFFWYTFGWEKAAEAKGQKSISWFELQFGERNNPHVDAVIINLSINELLVMEAKRFRNPTLKMKEISKDMERIHSLVAELKTEDRIEMDKIKKCYGVVLADVWTETDIKKQILDCYKASQKNPQDKESFINRYFPAKSREVILFKRIKKRRDTMDRNVNIIVGLNGEKIVLINDIRFKGKKREDWKEVESYLKEYVGEFYEIAETSEKIFISSSFPDEYAGSESRLALKGAVAKAKANAAQGIPELIQIAMNGEYSENTKKKHEKDAKYGWYRYDVRFALPVYDDKSGEVCRYNIFFARMLVRHDADGKKYLYDLLAIKKETSSPLE